MEFSTSTICSSLNFHLCCNLHVIDSPACRCGFHQEDPDHYFLSCPIYGDERSIMWEALNDINIGCAHDLLYGIGEANFNINSRIIDAAINFIVATRRF